MTRTAVVSILLAACASQPREVGLKPVSANVADSLRAEPACVIADSAGPPQDTVFAFDATLNTLAASDSAIAPLCRPLLVGARRPSVIWAQPPDGYDLRDAVDNKLPAGWPRIDVVVTTDADVLAYAARNPAFFVDTLPWTRVYVLVSTGPDSLWTFPSAEERDALARDAIRGEARGAVEPFAWLSPPPCTAPPAAPASPRQAVAFDSADTVARQLAERVVALASQRTRPRWIPRAVLPGARLAPMHRDSVSGSLLNGRATAFIFAFGFHPTAWCRSPIAPLVDTRPHVIVRRGSGVAFVVGSDGKFMFIKRGAP